MNTTSLRKFEKEIFSRGYGKDALIIDVRNNPGGFISDKLLAILTHPHHADTIPRGSSERSYPHGYLPVTTWSKPIVVLCNENSFSNAEIFSHAIKTLKRGTLIGVPTGGEVISTPKEKILDQGHAQCTRSRLVAKIHRYRYGDLGRDPRYHHLAPPRR